jgi:hypothetical protein
VADSSEAAFIPEPSAVPGSLWRSLGYVAEVQIAVGFALGLALVLGWRLCAGYPRPAAPLPGLSRRDAALVAAAAEALFPRGGAVPPSGLDAGVPAWCGRWLGALPAGTRLLVRCLFALVEHATLLFPAPGWDGFRRFSALDPERRGQVLEGWRTSRWFLRRLVFTSLRAIVTQGYFADAAVLRALGLAPFAIEAPVTTADTLYPPIGQPSTRVRFRPEQVEVRGPLDRPPAGAPLDLGSPLHPDYREPTT